MGTILARLTKPEGQSKAKTDSAGALKPKTLPKALDRIYLAEGAANIIFRLQGGEEQDALCKEMRTFLLRLRKTLKSSSPNLEAYLALKNRFLPILPKDGTVETQLVRLPPGLVEQENSHLRQLERDGIRPAKRHGLYLAEDEEYGFLIEDMSPSLDTEVLVEFKPKWLAQSPSAPRNWKRCRSCALRLMKLEKSASKDSFKFDGSHWFCPFDLASDHKERVGKAVDGILVLKGAIRGSRSAPGLSDAALEKLKELMVEALYLSKTIRKLRKLQRQLDPTGVLAALEGYQEGDDSKHLTDLATCMTLRDLTLFMKINLASETRSKHAVETKIGDLDVKSPENGKALYWTKVERDLADGGWYAATETNAHPDRFSSRGRFLCVLD